MLETNVVKNRILIVTATAVEASALEGIALPDGLDGPDFLVTGIGTMACAYGLTRYLSRNRLPLMAINAGISGSYRSDLPIGSTVVVRRDCFADYGVEEPGGCFIPAVKASLASGTGGIFDEGGWIECRNELMPILEGKTRFVTAITSDTVTGSPERVELIKSRFNPDIESMEGATFFYICALEKVPFLAVRAVSNRVGERDHSLWNIPLALGNLREKIEGILKFLPANG